MLLLAIVLIPAMAQGQGSAPGSPPSGEPAGLRNALDKLVRHGGVAVAENGTTVFAFGEGSYLPASIIKMVTALAAFHYLGPEYRFRTEVHKQEGWLYLRGYGDPYLVSEEWARMAAALSAGGHFAAPLRGLVVDGSAFSAHLEVDGASNSLNPYDARLGALVSNFNTVYLQVDAAGRVRSAEPQTPLTPLAEAIGGKLSPGAHRVNFTAYGISGLRYSGELARAIFEQGGARFMAAGDGEAIRMGAVPGGSRPVLVHRSRHTLRDVVAGMMEFSNNYVANQLVLVLALEKQGEPARLETGMALLRRFLTERVGLREDRFTLAEGSGLSRRNRIGLDAMLAVVDAFHPWAGLLQPYGRPPLRAAAKTGTLKGIYSLAGFLPAPHGVRRPFVIMLNQKRNTRDLVFRRLAAAYGPGG